MQVVITEETTVIALLVADAPPPPPYEPPPVTYTLSASVSGSGIIDVYPNKTTFSEGEVVQINAYPNPGYGFNHWEKGGVNIGASNPISFQMHSNVVITAVFLQSTSTEYVSQQVSSIWSYLENGTGNAPVQVRRNNQWAIYDPFTGEDTIDRLIAGETVYIYVVSNCTLIWKGHSYPLQTGLNILTWA
jgi:hypothetical protein